MKKEVYSLRSRSNHPTLLPSLPLCASAITLAGLCRFCDARLRQETVAGSFPTQAIQTVSDDHTVDGATCSEVSVCELS